MNSEYLNWIALLIALALFAIGFAAVLFPRFSSKGFGIETEGSGLHFVRATGIRDVFMGIIILLLFLNENRRLLAWACLAIAIVSITDFILTQKFGSKRQSLIHLAGTVGVIAYGLLLLFS